MPEPTPEHVSALRKVRLPALVALAVAVRLMYLLGDRANLNGDEAVTGIMVRRISHGQWFLFYPGQHYGGTLEVYLQALVFLVFRLPQNPVTLRLALVLLDAASTALIYLCGRRILPGTGQAVFAAAFFAVGPWFNVLLGATALGFYPVGVTLGLGALYCGLRCADHPAWSVGLGLCAGLALWNSLTSVYLILPALLYAWPHLRLWIAGVALGGLAGGAPMVIYTVASGHLPLPAPVAHPIGIGHRLGNLFDPVLREFLGLTFAHAQGGLPGWLQVTILVALAVAYAVALHRRTQKVLLAAPVLVAVVYVSSPMAAYTGTPRYLFSAYPLLALSIAALLPHRHPTVARTTQAVVLTLTAALCLSLFASSAAPHLGYRDRVLEQATRLLVSKGETAVYAEYSTAMNLQYIAGDRLDVAICQGSTRFPDTQRRVAAAAHPVYVDTTIAGGGLLTDPPDKIGAALAAAHVSFRTTQVGFVRIYDQLDPLPELSAACPR